MRSIIGNDLLCTIINSIAEKVRADYLGSAPHPLKQVRTQDQLLNALIEVQHYSSNKLAYKTSTSSLLGSIGNIARFS